MDKTENMDIKKDDYDDLGDNYIIDFQSIKRNKKKIIIVISIIIFSILAVIVGNLIYESSYVQSRRAAYGFIKTIGTENQSIDILEYTSFTFDDFNGVGDRYDGVIISDYKLISCKKIEDGYIISKDVLEDYNSSEEFENRKKKLKENNFNITILKDTDEVFEYQFNNSKLKQYDFIFQVEYSYNNSTIKTKNIHVISTQFHPQDYKYCVTKADRLN